MSLASYAEPISNDPFEGIIVCRLINQINNNKNQLFASITPLPTGEIVSKRFIGTNWDSHFDIDTPYTLSIAFAHPESRVATVKEFANNSKADFDWFLENFDQLNNTYKDEWIAISGKKLIGHSHDHKELVRIVKRKGIRCPFITKLVLENWE